MSKTTAFVEDPRESPWWDSLRRGDCLRLMNLLEENPCRVVQKGPGGCTVLHAAARRGCLKLLDQVFDLFGDNCRFVDEKKIKVSLKRLLKAQYIPKENRGGMGAVGLTAGDYAWWSMGECDARDYFYICKRDDSKPFVSYQSEIFRSCIVQAEGVDEGSMSPRTLLLEILARQKSLLPQIRLEEFEEDVEYNFVADCEELRFHHACENLRSEDYRKYVEAVIGGCVENGPHVLRYLFQLRNAQGQTPLHVAAHNYGCDILVGLIPGQESGDNAECVNVRDARGWTALHLVSALGMESWFLEELLEDGRVDVNATVHSYADTEVTALHVAVMHDRSTAVELLLANPKTDVNARFERRIIMDESLRVRCPDPDTWTALQWAAVVGSPELVKMLSAHPQVKDAGKRQKRINCWASLHGDKNHDVSYGTNTISAIHLAAASGDPETLRLLITNQEFDPLVTFGGSTSLHFAVAASQPKLLGNMYWLFGMRYFCNIDSFLFVKQKEAKNTKSFKGREACIGILAQAGVDVWQKNDRNNFPEPGKSASSEYHLAWQQKVEKETLEAKKGLNEAGNAISVVAALVATASYVGPLQPPLGYANDLVQSSNLSIRIFMVTNSTSFYLAIASILFAVVPSLPMPQEAIYKEWQRTRQTIGIAISLLLMSVLGILISFAAASNAVVSEEYSWQHRGLTFYPVIVGGLVCLIGVIWFFIRLLRLMFPKNERIRHLYQSLFKTEGKGI